MITIKPNSQPVKQLAVATCVAITLSACGGSDANTDSANTVPTNKNGQTPSVVFSSIKTPEMTSTIANIKQSRVRAVNTALTETYNTKLAEYQEAVANNSTTAVEPTEPTTYTVSGSQYMVTIGKTTYKDGDTIDLTKHFNKNAVTDVLVSDTLATGTDVTSGSLGVTQNIRGYRQDYSLIGGSRTLSVSSTISDISSASGASNMTVNLIKGVSTEALALPTTGIYNYSGKAFSQDSTKGVLSYDVNFDKRTGSGTIKGIDSDTVGTLKLEEGKIQSLNSHINPFDGSLVKYSGITGNVVSEYNNKVTGTTTTSGTTTTTNQDVFTGTYELGFFGPTGEEIVGKVSETSGTNNIDGEIGFAGKRGAKQ